MKSEPEVFSIDSLRAKKVEHWDGVRNYQARNFMKAMQEGDEAFFYHSNCPVPGIVGIMRVVRKAYPDFTAWDAKSPYFDPKSSADKPRWFMVDVAFKEKFSQVISLESLKQKPSLATMPLVRKGNRLSVMPVAPELWAEICSFAN